MIDSCRSLTDEALLHIGRLKQLKYLVMSLSPKVLLKLDAVLVFAIVALDE